MPTRPARWKEMTDDQKVEWREKHENGPRREKRSNVATKSRHAVPKAEAIPHLPDIIHGSPFFTERYFTPRSHFVYYENRRHIDLPLEHEDPYGLMFPLDLFETDCIEKGEAIETNTLMRIGDPLRRGNKRVRELFEESGYNGGWKFDTEKMLPFTKRQYTDEQYQRFYKSYVEGNQLSEDTVIKTEDGEEVTTQTYVREQFESALASTKHFIGCGTDLDDKFRPIGDSANLLGDDVAPTGRKIQFPQDYVHVRVEDEPYVYLATEVQPRLIPYRDYYGQIVYNYDGTVKMENGFPLCVHPAVSYHVCTQFAVPNTRPYRKPSLPDDVETVVGLDDYENAISEDNADRKFRQASINKSILNRNYRMKREMWKRQREDPFGDLDDVIEFFDEVDAAPNGDYMLLGKAVHVSHTEENHRKRRRARKHAKKQQEVQQFLPPKKHIPLQRFYEEVHSQHDFLLDKHTKLYSKLWKEIEEEPEPDECPLYDRKGNLIVSTRKLHSGYVPTEEENEYEEMLKELTFSAFFSEAKFWRKD